MRTHEAFVRRLMRLPDAVEPIGLRDARPGLEVESGSGNRGRIAKCPTSMRNDHTVTVEWANGGRSRVNLMNLRRVL